MKFTNGPQNCILPLLRYLYISVALVPRFYLDYLDSVF